MSLGEFFSQATAAKQLAQKAAALRQDIGMQKITLNQLYLCSERLGGAAAQEIEQLFAKKTLSLKPAAIASVVATLPLICGEMKRLFDSSKSNPSKAELTASLTLLKLIVSTLHVVSATLQLEFSN